VETQAPNTIFTLWAKPYQPQRKTAARVLPSITSVIGSTLTRGSTTTEPQKAKKAPKKVIILTTETTTKAPRSRESSAEIERPNRAFNLTRPKINLYSFQKLIDYSLVPVEHNITLEGYNARETEKKDYIVPLRSVAVVGESGSGLSTLLANRALNNYRSNKPSIILAHGEHQLHSLAQTLLDCADHHERESLLNSIEFVTGNHPVATIDQNKKIYIVSTDKLSSYLEKNPSFRQTSHPTMTRGGQTWGQALAHQKLSEILPLYRAPELLVDDAHSYTGVANQGFTKILATLLHEINSHTNQAVNIFGTSATPFARKIQDEQKQQPNQGLTKTLQLEDFFPDNSRKQTPSANELIENLKHYKTPSLSLIQLDPEAQAALENTDAANRLLDASGSSINAGIVKLYKPGKKWHIIANSRAQATQLCGLFNQQGIKALVLTSPETRDGKIIGHSGYFEKSTNDSEGNFLELNDGNSTKMRAIKRSQENILNDYENGDCDVLIELDTPATHSTITDTVVDLTLRYDQANTHIKRLLGEAVRHPRKHDIEYIFLNPDNHQVFSQLISGQALELQPQGKGSSDSTDATITPTVTPMSTTTNISRSGGIEHHKIWFNLLQQKLDSIYPGSSLTDQISKLVNDFKKLSKKTDDETKAIVLGLVKDTKVFRELVNFLGLNAIETNINVPDLMGVEEESVALRVLEKQYEIVALSYAYIPNEPWLKRLDGALRLADNANGVTRERYRLKLFSEILFKKFGKEVFENRSFLDHALRVFTGDRVDYRLFGLLVNALASNEPSEVGTGFSFSDIVKEFSELTGSRVQVPFSELQKQILERYPEPPENIDVFFRQGLYDDFSLDFGSLVDAVRQESQDSDQKIIDGSVADEIQQFLKANYQAKAEQNMPVGTKLREDERLKLELDLKSKDDLSTITKEILYSQLISKIWGHSAKLKIHEENFTIELGPDSLNLKEREPSSIESAIDIFQVNPDLAILYDHQDYDSAYDRMDIKTRLARSISNFIIDRHNLSADEPNPLNTQPEKNDLTITRSQASHINPSPVTKTPAKFTKAELTEAQKRDIQVLTGAISREELTPADKKLLRDFFQAKNIKIDKRLLEFYDRLGVETIQEAQLIIKDQLKRTNPDQKWVKKIQNFDNLISEFIFGHKKDIFNQDPKKLFELVSILSGDISGANKQEAQDLIREFVGFAQTKDSSITLINLLPEHHNLLGIKNLEELQKVILSFTEPTPESIKSSNNQIKKALEVITKKLDLTNEELYRIAGIENPIGFYMEPLDKSITDFACKLEFKPEHDIINKLKSSLAENSQNIQAREFLKLIYGNKFQHPTSIIELGPEDWPYKLKLDLNKDTPDKASIKLSIIHYPSKDKSLKTEFKNKLDQVEGYQIGDTDEYNYENGQWTLTEQEKLLEHRYMKVALSYLNFILNNTNWSHTKNQGWSNTLITGNPGKRYYPFISVCDAFIRDQLKSGNNLLPQNSQDLVKETVELILSGPEPYDNSKMTQKDKQNLIRAFIEFTNREENKSIKGSLVINLEDVLKQNPKAVGIRSVEEMKTVVNANKEIFECIKNSGDDFDQVKSLIGQLGITMDEIKALELNTEIAKSTLTTLEQILVNIPIDSNDRSNLETAVKMNLLRNYILGRNDNIEIIMRSCNLMFCFNNNQIIYDFKKGKEYGNKIFNFKNGKFEEGVLSNNHKLLRSRLFSISMLPRTQDAKEILFYFYKVYESAKNLTSTFEFSNLLTRFYESKYPYQDFQSLELLGVNYNKDEFNQSKFITDLEEFLEFACKEEPTSYTEEVIKTIKSKLEESKKETFLFVKNQIKHGKGFKNIFRNMNSDSLGLFEKQFQKEFPGVKINEFYNYLSIPQNFSNFIKEGLKAVLDDEDFTQSEKLEITKEFNKLSNKEEMKILIIQEVITPKNDNTVTYRRINRDFNYIYLFNGREFGIFQTNKNNNPPVSFERLQLRKAIRYDFRSRTWFKVQQFLDKFAETDINWKEVIQSSPY
jgi:hypothetical protein